MARRKKRPRIYEEEVKVPHTSHWDLDYLPRKDLDALYADSSKKLKSPTQASKPKSGLMAKLLKMVKALKNVRHTNR